MSKVIITRGLPGSGKSTWSKQYVLDHVNFRRINRDDLRFMILDGYYDKDRERVVALARDLLLRAFLREGYDIVLDETFLIPKNQRRVYELIQRAKEDFGIEIDIAIQDFIDVPLEVCIERDKPRGRDKTVGEKVIRMYYTKYVIPLLHEKKHKNIA